MRKWLCRLRPSSKQVSRCLPTAHPQHRAPGEVVLGQPGVAQLSAQEQLPGERRVQALPGEVDDVALGHVSTVAGNPSRTRPGPPGAGHRRRRGRRRAYTESPAGRPRRDWACSRARRPGRAAPAGRMSATTAAAHDVDSPRPRYAGSVTTPTSSCCVPTKNAVATATGRPSAAATHAAPDAASPAFPPQVSEIRRSTGPAPRALRRRWTPAGGPMPGPGPCLVGQHRDDPFPDRDRCHRLSSAGRHRDGASTSPRSPGTATGSPRHATLPPGSSARPVRGSTRRSARHRPTPEAASTCCWISRPGRSGRTAWPPPPAGPLQGHATSVRRRVPSPGTTEEMAWRARPRLCPPSLSCCSARWSPSTTGYSCASSARRCAPWATCTRAPRVHGRGPGRGRPRPRRPLRRRRHLRQHHPDAAEARVACSRTRTTAIDIRRPRAVM